MFGCEKRWNISQPVKGLSNIYDSTGPVNFIFRDKITNRSRIYKSLKIQVSIQDIGSNTCFIQAEGQMDELDVKKSPIFTILRVKTITFMTQKKSYRWFRIKFDGPVLP